ncbi:MAG TPA: NADH-quinone oxidoreductase subunit K [Candidatus Tectomicrobia bacterium]|nr:NADH-quinone oxidoreductase subunit K [Candidatus Tectomicrobia bacterium]
MTLFLALSTAVLFGAGVFLLLRRDLLRDAAGLILVFNAATLFVMAAGLRRGRAPILPARGEATISDPLVQAMALTAVVITFGITAFLLSLVCKVWATHGTIDQDDLMQAEARDEERLERRGRRAA